MAPIGSPVKLANGVRRSMQCVAIVAVVVDSAADGILPAAVGTVASIAEAVGWIARWIVVGGESYLQGSDCNQESACKA